MIQSPLSPFYLSSSTHKWSCVASYVTGLQVKVYRIVAPEVSPLLVAWLRLRGCRSTG